MTTNLQQNISDMLKVFESYFSFLANNPGQINGIIQWTLCVVWSEFLIWKFRERIIKGMEGLNLLFESGEVIAFISIVCFPPTLFNLAFFKDTQLYQFYALLAEGAIFACTLYGRYLFDWALAFKTGASSVTSSVQTTATIEKVETNQQQ